MKKRTIEISEETYQRLKDQLVDTSKETKKAKIEIKTFGGSLLYSSEVVLT